MAQRSKKSKLSPSRASSVSRNGSSRGVPEPIAIVGIGCRFPGGAHSPEAFWRLLCEGVDAISAVPADRSDLRELYDPTPGVPGKIVAKEGGFLSDLDKFDPYSLEISPREATYIDPQQRLLLEYHLGSVRGRRYRSWEGARQCGRFYRDVDQRLRRSNVRRHARHRSLHHDGRRSLFGLGPAFVHL